MKVSFVGRWSIVLAGGLAISAAPPVEATTTAATVPIRASGSQATSSAYSWLLRALLRWLTSWAAGRALDHALDRAGLLPLTRAAADEAEVHQSAPITPEERATLRQTALQLRVVEELLADNEIGDAEVREYILRLSNSLENLERRLEQVDRRLFMIELEQKRQLRMIVDAQGDIVELRQQLVDHEGRIVDLDDRVSALEETVYPDPNRFLRHDIYVSGDVLYASQAWRASHGQIALRGDAQYNFSKLIGVGGSLLAVPIYVGTGESANGRMEDLYWFNLAAMIGPSVHLLPPQSPISLRLSGAGGLVWSSLYGVRQEATVWSESKTQRDATYNVAATTRVDVGIAPPAFGLEALVSAGYLAFFSGIESTTHEIARVGNPRLWYVGIGVRGRIFQR